MVDLRGVSRLGGRVKAGGFIVVETARPLKHKSDGDVTGDQDRAERRKGPASAAGPFRYVLVRAARVTCTSP